jgi:hypothetical protein
MACDACINSRNLDKSRHPLLGLFPGKFFCILDRFFDQVGSQLFAFVKIFIASDPIGFRNQLGFCVTDAKANMAFTGYQIYFQKFSRTKSADPSVDASTCVIISAGDLQSGRNRPFDGHQFIYGAGANSGMILKHQIVIGF